MLFLYPIFFWWVCLPCSLLLLHAITISHWLELLDRWWHNSNSVLTSGYASVHVLICCVILTFCFHKTTEFSPFLWKDLSKRVLLSVIVLFIFVTWDFQQTPKLGLYVLMIFRRENLLICMINGDPKWRNLTSLITRIGINTQEKSYVHLLRTEFDHPEVTLCRTSKSSYWPTLMKQNRIHGTSFRTMTSCWGMTSGSWLPPCMKSCTGLRTICRRPQISFQELLSKRKLTEQKE